MVFDNQTILVNGLKAFLWAILEVIRSNCDFHDDYSIEFEHRPSIHVDKANTYDDIYTSQNTTVLFASSWEC